MSGVPVRTSPLHHSPPRLGESHIPLAFPKTSRPRQSRGAMDNQVRLQAGLGSSAGCGSFLGRGADPHAFHPVLPIPASSTANAASLPGTGSRWSPGWRRISSGLGMEQPHAAATNPNSPAGAEQAGLFIWEELSCCRSIRFPAKQRAARCLDHFCRCT